jgi:hypothetical protein
LCHAIHDQQGQAAVRRIQGVLALAKKSRNRERRTPQYMLHRCVEDFAEFTRAR